MTHQRRRGQPALIYKSKPATDRRGNVMNSVDFEGPYVERIWVIPQRGSRAEVPGQQDINIVTIGCTPELLGVDLWSRVDWRGSSWDVVAPPGYHHGTRHTRHWTVDLRERP